MNCTLCSKEIPQERIQAAQNCGETTRFCSRSCRDAYHKLSNRKARQEKLKSIGLEEKMAEYRKDGTCKFCKGQIPIELIQSGKPLPKYCSLQCHSDSRLTKTAKIAKERKISAYNLNPPKCFACDKVLPLERFLVPGCPPKYCDEGCRLIAQRHVKGERKAAQLKRLVHLSDGYTNTIVGTSHEYLVIADLMMQGFEVFKSCSPHAPVDLVILKGTKMARIECRTASRGNRGGILFARNSDKTLTDLYAAILPDKTIVYEKEGAFTVPDEWGMN